MTLEELKKEYGNNCVFLNQLEMGSFIHDYGVKNNLRNIVERFPPNKVKHNNEIYYDIAELALRKSISFFNDGYYIIDSLDELKDI